MNEQNPDACRPTTVAAPRCCVLGPVALALAILPVMARADGPEVVASGLSNPRGIAFAPDGGLYVAEAGRGGPGPCIPSASQPVQRCYGETGALTRILPQGGYERVLTGLPSLAFPNGTVEGGPVDVSFHGMAAYLTLGWAGNPSGRTSVGHKAGLLGKLLRVTPGGSYQVVADLAGHEASDNPDGGAVDSNPYRSLAQPGRRITADAGANDLVETLASGETRTLAVMPKLADGREAVPTSVVEGPDGALYVGLLTGFPFFKNTASVLRVASDGSQVESFASGFTAIVDVAFDAGGALYVLEIASGQVGPPTPPSPGLGAGRLLRQCPGSTPEVLLSGLIFPGGVAIGPDGAVYMTNKGTSPTDGEVLRMPVAPCGTD